MLAGIRRPAESDATGDDDDGPMARAEEEEGLVLGVGEKSSDLRLDSQPDDVARRGDEGGVSVDMDMREREI